MDDKTIDENKGYSMSLYKTIAALSVEHGVYLIQNERTGRVYVKKELQRYDLSVYQALYKNRIQGIPAIIELVENDGIPRQGHYITEKLSALGLHCYFTGCVGKRMCLLGLSLVMA